MSEARVQHQTRVVQQMHVRAQRESHRCRGTHQGSEPDPVGGVILNAGPDAQALLLGQLPDVFLGELQGQHVPDDRWAG